MKEHEDDAMLSVDSSAVDEIVTKTEGFLAERDEGEDMMVDVVGVDDHHNDGTTGVNLVSNAGSDSLVEKCARKEVAGSVGIWVLNTEKNDVIVNEEGLKSSAEGSVIITTVASESNGDVSVIDTTELTERGLTEEVLEKHVETVEEAGISEEVDMVVMEEGFAGRDGRGKEESTNPIIKVITDDAQQVTDGDGVVNEKIGKENEGLDSSSKISESFSEEVEAVVVDALSTEVVSSAPGESDINVRAENLDQQAEVEKLSLESTTEDSEKSENGTGAVDTKLAVESSGGEPQFGGETAAIDKEETERGLTKDDTIVEQPTESVQEVTFGVAMDDRMEKENEVLDFSKIPESLTVNLGPQEVLTKKNEAQDSDSADLMLVFPDNRSVSTEFVKLPESSIDSSIPVTANRVIETDDEGQNCKMELPITSDMSRPIEKQGLKVEAVNTGSIVDGTVCVKPSNDGDEILTGHIKISNSNVEVPSTIEMNGFQVSADAFEEIDGVTPIEDVAKESEHSYEDAQMEGGDDEGMNIDEVLGWKDDGGIVVISGAEKDQHFNVNATSEADVEQRLPESSCEPVQIRHQEENLESREPIVYGRRAHVEVPVYDSLDVSGSPLLEDENIEIETDSDEEEDDDEFMQEHEHQLTGPSVPGSFFSLYQSRYFQSPEHEGEFSVSDLVWGKVRSHPWWPGQIIDPSNASNKAMKYHKKDCFLVAYFGDGTFAWNNSAVLKPFRANFSQIEKHTNLDAFKNAVECALEEVTRRVELGLACSCVSKDVYKKIEYQVMENGGVRKKYYTRHGKDESCSSSSFEPDKLVDYVKLLAQFPGEGDKMELAMAKAQLSSYCRFKGYRELPEFCFCGDLLEDAEKLDKNVEKLENNLIENACLNKEISLSDLTDDAPESGYGDIITSKSVSSSGYKKRKARDSISNGSVKRPNRQPDKVSTPPISTPRPSFKIGALIQRVASQLTGPTPLKSNSENGQHADQVLGSPVSLQTPETFQKEASVAEMLSQLHLTAQDPMKRYGFLQTIIPFFYDRRAAVFSKSLKKHYPIIEKPDSDRKRKASNENDPEEFEFVFDEINDSYWTDRIIQNHSEDQSLQDHQNGGIDYQQVVAYEQDKPAKRGRKKRVFSSDHKVKVKVESEADKRRRENLATEVVLKFTEGIYFPPEIQLNKMFGRFGTLIESETEVDMQGGRARVVFKKCRDAEVAHSSAGKINIFGSINVNYELNYTPLVSYKPLPLLILQNPMNAS